MEEMASGNDSVLLRVFGIFLSPALGICGAAELIGCHTPGQKAHIVTSTCQREGASGALGEVQPKLGTTTHHSQYLGEIC